MVELDVKCKFRINNNQLELIKSRLTDNIITACDLISCSNLSCDSCKLDECDNPIITIDNIKIKNDYTIDELDKLRGLYAFGYNYVATDKCGFQYAYKLKPHRDGDSWDCESYDSIISLLSLKFKLETNKWEDDLIDIEALLKERGRL